MVTSERDFEWRYLFLNIFSKPLSRSDVYKAPYLGDIYFLALKPQYLDHLGLLDGK
jgi:hypothetical protein